MAKRHNHRASGFSLVELMVAVVVMAIVTSQLLFSFSQQHTSSLEHERTIEIQEEVRLIKDVVLKDMRIAGFMVPQYAAIASRDGGTAASDAICVSDSSVIDDTTLADATSRFSGATVSTAFAGASTSVAVNSGTTDIDSDGDVDFTIGDGVILANGTASHCATVTGRTATSITFTPATPSTFSMTPGDSVVPAVIYTVTGTTLSRNNMVLSSHIEDLQAEFGVDADRNGTVEGAEFPLDDLSGQEYELVENVRIHLTAREQRTEEGFPGQFAAIANRVAGSADNFKRRRVTGDAVLRNLR